MGLGFRLNLKWGFPLHSQFNTTSPSKLFSSSPVRGKEASFNSARLSFLLFISEESENFSKDPVKAYSCSSAFPQILEDDLSEMDEGAAGEDNFVSIEDLKAWKASPFNLLMQNVGVLEESFEDSDVLKLEREILLQLGRLGALKLFKTCLSRTLETSKLLDSSNNLTEQIEERRINSETDSHKGKAIIRSRKREERKSRKRRLEMNNRVVSQDSETIWHGLQKPTVTTGKRLSNSRRRRLPIAKNEAEMSMGVKAVAKLERIRTVLEKETGRVTSLSSWAEAAGVDEKVLLQQLHFGWYCRDELLRSTKSLVLFFVRNYRGLGIASEDLLQAGNLGVLQGAERFDHTRGYRFSTYVHYWIRKSMSRLVARHARGIHIPCSLSKAINQIQKTRKANNVNNNLRKFPDDNEIAKLTGLSLAKIRSASQCLRVVGSVDQRMGDFFPGKYKEFTPDMSVKTPEETVMRQHMKKDINDLLLGLDSRERQVLILRYGLKNCHPKSLEEIGRHFRVSKEWIRKIEKKALEKLRDEETNRNLSHYLKL
ncbi:hypothetical protein UlMin_034824 [Ulmus minor]